MGRIAIAIALASCLAVSGATARAAALTVFAAASLKEALDEAAKRFETDTGNRVVISYAGSNALAKQIESGAPADLFIAADLEWTDFLEQRRLVVPGSRIKLLRNTLVLIAPAASPVRLKIGRDLALAAALGGGKMAMANLDSVPAGKYAKAAPEALDLWTQVQPQVVRAENVRAALTLVARGEAPLGIVYRTDALAEKRVRIVDTFPESSHPPIVYPAAPIAGGDAPAAKTLLDFLRSTAARPTWEKYGFAPF